MYMSEHMHLHEDGRRRNGTNTQGWIVCHVRFVQYFARRSEDNETRSYDLHLSGIPMKSEEVV
jgi:hypothetical protein